MSEKQHSRHVVFVCCDGLGREWVTPRLTPALHDVARRSLWCAEHRAVFPAVTRVSAASIATGCWPGRHGLHGNRMALLEDGRLVVRDVGLPDFRSHMRRATAGTLRVPALAERVADSGGFIAFSNVSPGAAYFLDPEHFGHVYHRAGSYAPGGVPVPAADALAISHDLAGDRAMARRFCGELMCRRPRVAVLWLANPDLTLHSAPLGSPAHEEALRETDRCVRAVIDAVEEQRAAGDEVLLAIGSDHGQETIGACLDMESWLATQGLAAALANGQIAVASQGTAALLYATDEGRAGLLSALDAMLAESWADEIAAGDRLTALGHAASGGVVAAVNMARTDEANPYGIRGRRWTVAEPGKPPAIGSGQHGGWGPDETRPFLLLNAPDVAPAALDLRTSLVDIAPTVLAFLGLPHGEVDGAPLLKS
ncbi:MAG: alkaline phosphatase family protein [Alphaproteobacteria bacterium]|nr:alkaline phosphatase family protein [Alphaproteobacteria bacterium]